MTEYQLEPAEVPPSGATYIPAFTVRAGLASSSAGAGETEAPRDGEGG